MSWRGREARVAAYRGKLHGRKSVQGLAMARREFGELTGGELTRFDCMCYLATVTDESGFKSQAGWIICVKL